MPEPAVRLEAKTVKIVNPEGDKLTPKTTAAKELAGKIGTELKTKQATQIMTEQAVIDNVPVHVGRRNMENNVGTTRDETTGAIKRDGKETKLYKKLTNAQKEVDQFLAGYEKLTDIQRDKLRPLAEQVLYEKIPDLEKTLAGVDPAIKKELFDRLLSDQEVRLALKEENAKLLATKLEDNVSEARAKYNAAEEAKNDNQTERDNIATEKGTIDNALKEFEVGGKHYSELQSAEQCQEDYDVTFEKVNGLKKTLDRLNSRLDIVDGEDAKGLEILIQKKEGALETAKAEQREALNKLNKVKDLEAQRDQSKARKAELEVRRIDLEKVKADLDKEFILAKEEFKSSQRARAEEEEDYVYENENLILNALRKVVTERIRVTEEAEQAVLGKEVEQATDVAMKSLLKKMNENYREEKIGRKGKLIYKQKKQKINEHWQKGLPEGGDNLVKEYLSGSGLTLEQQTEKLNNPEFMKSAREKVMERLIREKLKMGTLTTSEADYIADTDWGEGLIERAIQRNKEVEEQIKKDFGEGNLKAGSYLEGIKKKSKGSVLKYLMLLFGTLAFGAVPLYNAAKGSLEG